MAQPQQGCPTPQPVSHQPEAGSPLQQAGNPPQQAGNLPQQAGNHPQQAGNPPQQAGNPPQQAGNLPQQAGNHPQQAGNPPQQVGNPPQQTGNHPQQAGNPPQQVGNPQQQHGHQPDGNGQPPVVVQQPGSSGTVRVFPPNTVSPAITVSPGNQPPANPEGSNKTCPVPVDLFAANSPPKISVPGPAPPNQWIPPQPPPGCPPGLEYLAQVDQLLVKQQVEVMEVLTGYETNNKYEVQNSMGQHVFFAVEDNDCCTRWCCGPSRPFQMRILDNFKREVIHLSRPLRCSSSCFPCFLQELEVSIPQGAPLGYVSQNWSLCAPRFEIQDAEKNPVLFIQGPICTNRTCCVDINFKVLASDGRTEVGKITKQWSGYLKERYTDADNFGITFPMDLDVKIKAVMLGACFLIDFMFYEQSSK